MTWLAFQNHPSGTVSTRDWGQGSKLGRSIRTLGQKLRQEVLVARTGIEVVNVMGSLTSESECVFKISSPGFAATWDVERSQW